MGILYNLYEKNNIPIDNDIFVSTLFYQINLVNDFPFLEIGFKNKLIPKNNKLGMYLIDKAIHTKNIITDWEKIFDLGIENLLLNEEGLGQAIDELFENNKYFDCFDLIIDFYTKINLQKNEDKGKMNYIKRMVSGQFNALNKNNNNENNIQQNDENIQENNDE